MESVTSSSSSAPATFSLRGKPRSIELEAEGIHHPTGARFGGPLYTAYRDITHLASSSRAIWIGTRRSVYVIPRRAFVDPHGPEHLVRALLEHIARQPGGSAQLAHMAEIEETAREVRSLRATWALVIACAAIYAAQLLGGGNVYTVGYFAGGLAADGDWWRIVTGNLLHVNAVHLILNLLGLLAVGSIVERALGTAATACVMAASGLGAMAAAWWSPLPVVGVSGIVFGLLAAALWIELCFGGELPAWWRVPRRALFGATALSTLISFLPFVAGGAHAGGFAAGGLAAAALAPRGLRLDPSGIGLRTAAGVSAAVAAFAIAAAGYELLRDGEFAARFAARLARLPDVSANELNNHAWTIAVDERSSPALLEAALELAERAADETQHSEPYILDTLAEVHFQLGHRVEAVAAIDEAIQRAPGEDYYREQRRRFLGERDPEDRPDYVPPEQRESEPEHEAPDEGGLSV
ncbi:MAG TPA: rhomboid family intramembrane serine protease [Myxococcota bacterium]|nr:rhomboid family intramembrane serine protease [Myxococcota bacterium]